MTAGDQKDKISGTYIKRCIFYSLGYNCLTNVVIIYVSDIVEQDKMPGHRGETKGEPAGGGGQPVSADQDAVNKGIDKMYKIYEKLSSATEKTTVSFISE